MNNKMILTFLTFIAVIVIGIKIKFNKDENQKRERYPSSESRENNSSDNYQSESTTSSFFNSENTYKLKAERQEDMNIICRSRAAVKIAVASYDEYIWKCNHPPYGVRYTDCSQYNADVMARQVRQIADQRDQNEIDFARKWKIDPTTHVTCY